MRNTFLAAIATLCALLFSMATNGQNISTIAGNGISGWTGEGGPATAASFVEPYGVCIDTFGNVYVSDVYTNVIKKIDHATGIIHTIAGISTVHGTGGENVSPTSVAFDGIYNLFITKAGDLYFVDKANNKIRKIAASTGLVTTVAGSGSTGYWGDGGPATAAGMQMPSGLFVDTAGNVYFGDNARVVRKVTASTGIISKVAGQISSCGYTGDGSAATGAQLCIPEGVVLDRAGNIYISDQQNAVIRKVNTAGIISTYAGSTIATGCPGDGGPVSAAHFFVPAAPCIDTLDNIYLPDAGSHVIRMINTTTGIVTHIAGICDSSGFAGDGGPAATAVLYNPRAICVDKYRNLYFNDVNNFRVRKITAPPVVSTSVGSIQPLADINIYPNPSNGQFTIMNCHEGTVEVYNSIGVMVHQQSVSGSKSDIDISNCSPGVYVVRISTTEGIAVRRISIY